MTQSTKILIVEDEQVVAMDVELQLRDLGYDVTAVATSGKEALDCVEQHSPDLVLMDIQLHGSMDGITVAGKIRERWQLPVIFVTAYANSELVDRAKETKPYGYLTKPYSRNELNATIAVALEQHRLFREMFDEHGWLRTMLASMNDGVIATDAAGTVKYLNAVAENLTGWTLDEASTRPIRDVYPVRAVDGNPLEMCQLGRVLTSGQPVGRQRFLLAARDGQEVTVEDSAAAIRDAAGGLAGAVTVILDVTERQRVERERDCLLQELERSNADLERFAYAVAHDLQSPVRSVTSVAELLFNRLQAQISEKDAQLLRLIIAAAGGMHRLIQSLLEYAVAGHGTLHHEEFAVAELIDAIQSDLADLMADTGAEIFCGPLPTLYADEIQLRQVLQNLIVNAIHYRSPERSPRISISGDTTQEGWQIAVADNGRGIAVVDQARIFELLTRLDGPEIQGSGIGLALCRTIVERHGGKIWCESEGPGGGSTFFFTLAPKQQSASHPLAHARANAANTAN